MIDAQKLQADLETHHIEGIAHEGNTSFSCPLITPIEDNLWQGGCIGGVDLQGYFKHIVSLDPFVEWVEKQMRRPLFGNIRTIDELSESLRRDFKSVQAWGWTYRNLGVGVVRLVK